MSRSGTIYPRHSSFRSIEDILDEAEETFARLRKDLALAIQALKSADPEGWEAWYDDDKNVPDFRTNDVAGIRRAIRCVEQRTAELSKKESQ